MMASANLTVRVDKETKKEFDDFCKNVGINASSAVNMFIKTVLRTRTLPSVTDVDDNEQSMVEMKRAIESMRKRSLENGNSDMSLDEINAEINAARQDLQVR